MCFIECKFLTMRKLSITIGLFLGTVLSVFSQTIVTPTDASLPEQQAAKEIRRYIFLRTGTAPAMAIADNYSSLPAGDVIVVSADSSIIINELKQDYGNVSAPNSDNRMGYIIKSVSKDGRNVLVITGADSTTTLTAAYRFAELIGCHFNLAGDVIPDIKISFPLDISSYDEKAQPWFEMRGCLPFHNFLAGPDLWETQDYKSFISQQAKMGFNFFGLHVYGEYSEYGPGSDPEASEMEGPEPQLWIGHKEDVNPDGSIKDSAAYYSAWASSFRTERNAWSNAPIKASDFTNGADKLFPYDEAASEAIGLKEPVTPAEKAANFNNVGNLLKESFTHAQQLGVKTVLGNTAPIGFMPKPNDEIYEDRVHFSPTEVQNRAQNVHGLKLPASRGYTNEVFAKTMYEGVFTRIARTHPLDYYWLWTYETMTYSGDGLNSITVDAVADDYRYCSEVMTAINPPFKMATFGWKVGTAGFRSPLEFDDDVPKDVPFGTLWDNAEGIGQVISAGREGWSSVWYEEDWGLIQPQLRSMDTWFEVGAGLRVGGVQALIAKHWRINSIAPASLAHAQLSWDNRTTVDGTLLTISEGANKYREFDKWNTPVSNQDTSFVNWITQHYTDWAKANFGPEKANEIGALLAMADRLGEVHQIRNGVKGGIPKTARFLPSAITELWEDEGDIIDYNDPKYIDAMHVYNEFCSYKDSIVGKGNIDRYMYWYNFFQAQLEIGKLLVHEYNYRPSNNPTTAEKDSIMKSWAKVMKHEINRVRNASELGIIAQLQQSTWGKVFLGDHGITDRDTLLEADKALRAYPEITQIYENDSLKQKVLFIGNGEISSPTIYYREIGSSGAFASTALTPIGSSQNIMRAILADPGYDFEYFIQGTIGSDTVTYPVTGGDDAGNINKTVISIKKIEFKAQELTPYQMPTSYTLATTVAPENTGLISLNPSEGLYSEGTIVTLTVNANNGFKFDSWGGDLSGNSNPISITMDGNKSVTANFILDPTSSTNVKLENALLVYPNPVDNELFIETKGNIEEIRIFNALGKLMLYDENPTQPIDLGGLTKGVYFLSVKTSKSTEFSKIIKQ